MLRAPPELCLNFLALEATPFLMVLSPDWTWGSPGVMVWGGEVWNKYWHLVPLPEAPIWCAWVETQTSEFFKQLPSNSSTQLGLWATALQCTWLCHFLCYMWKELLHLENSSNTFLPSLVSPKYWNRISNSKPIFFMWKYSISDLVRNDDH